MTRLSVRTVSYATDGAIDAILLDNRGSAGMARLSAPDLLRAVMKDDIALSLELAKRVTRPSTGDPTYPFQTAAIVIFLAGVDKALSVAFQLLYLAGKVDWNWLKPFSQRAGAIGCGPGLTKKLQKLKTLGLDLDDLRWVVDFRNAYVHSCSIETGYALGMTEEDTPRLTLRPRRLEISRYAAPLTPITTGRDLKRWATEFVKLVGEFVDRSGWQEKWKLIDAKLLSLPVDPEPAFKRATQAKSFEEVFRFVEPLNKKYLGAGLVRLLSNSTTV